MHNTTCVCVCVCVCEIDELHQILQRCTCCSTVGGYFLLCRVISLLSATGLQVTHAHNEQ